jgi:HEAT repeat protein
VAGQGDEAQRGLRGQILCDGRPISVMDTNSPPPSDKKLPSVVADLLRLARASSIEDRRGAIEKLYELAYKVGPKIADAIPTLIDALLDRDEKIGESALWALKYCKPDSVEPLIGCLTHGEAFVRERAAHSLGNIGDEARTAATTLRGLLIDPDQSVRKRAAWALGLTHDTDLMTISELIKTAERGSEIDKGAALHALGNIGKALDDPSVLRPYQPSILHALQDSSSEVRWSALYASESLGLEPQPTAALMLTVLQGEQSSRVIEAVLSRLKTLAPLVDRTTQVPTLMQFLGKPGREASLACEILSSMRPAPKQAIDALVQALRIDRLVLPAATALWKIDGRVNEILPALERIFDAYDESVCDLICEIGPAAAPLLPKLIRALAEENWDLQWAAADALGAVASPEPSVMAALFDGLAHPSPIVRSAAARALARIGSPAVPMLRVLVADADDQRNAGAAFACGQMGLAAAPALPELRSGMRLGQEPLSSCCAIALARVAGDIESIPYLIDVLQSDDAQAPRRSAASALGALGPAARPAIDALEAVLICDDIDVAQAAEEALAAIRQLAQ